MTSAGSLLRFVACSSYRLARIRRSVLLRHTPFREAADATAEASSRPRSALPWHLERRGKPTTIRHVMLVRER
ncbi:unnamed protein product [Urochloa humidicola]